jgi:CDP-diacylglycerol--glycerol-3-phosphate 3-phosphatidyltransferase
VPNFPIILTWLRIFATPLLVVFFFLPIAHWQDICASLLFVILAMTDWLDGYLARRWNKTTTLGAFLDPVADKFLVITGVLLLLYLERIGIVLALLLVTREIVVSALRDWMAQQGKNKYVMVDKLGKAKTAIQMVAIPILLLGPHYFYEFGLILLWLSALLSIVSMVNYFYQAMMNRH